VNHIVGWHDVRLTRIDLQPHGWVIWPVPHEPVTHQQPAIILIDVFGIAQANGMEHVHQRQIDEKKIARLAAKVDTDAIARPVAMPQRQPVPAIDMQPGEPPSVAAEFILRQGRSDWVRRYGKRFG
jgi:hypothetical protein